MSNRGRRRFAWAVVVLLAIDLVSVYLCLASEEWPRVLLGTVAVTVSGYLARLAVVISRMAAAYESVALTLLAPLLPVAEARNWLPELEGQICEAGPGRERMLVVDAIHAFPRVWLTAWATRARSHLVRLAIRCVRPPITSINQALRSPQAVTWPEDRAAQRRLVRQFRRLHRYAAILARCLGDRYERELAALARDLARRCSEVMRIMRDTAIAPHRRWPTPVEVALLLEINHTTMVLAGLLSERRGRAP